MLVLVLVLSAVGAQKWTLDMDRGGDRSSVSGTGRPGRVLCSVGVPGSCCPEGRLRTRDSRLENSGLAIAGPGVPALQKIRCHGIWASGEVRAAKGTAEKRVLLIGKAALLNRARYVPCTRTALDWADTADLPSANAGWQVPRYSGIYLPGNISTST